MSELNMEREYVIPRGSCYVRIICGRKELCIDKFPCDTCWVKDRCEVPDFIKAIKELDKNECND